LQVKFDGDAGKVVINGTAYFLHQLHWHAPSEHTVNGRRYDMELHLVHQSAENKAAVIGVLYEVGPHGDGFLRKLEPFVRRIADRKDSEERLGFVDPHGARGRASVYYRYMGSLTTPPCTEGVVWTIVRRVRCRRSHSSVSCLLNFPPLLGFFDGL
jgi:carbonic anhydrase